MSLLSEKYLARCAGLHKTAQSRWGDRLFGRAVATEFAAGDTVSGYHDYSTGDDFRYIDWNRCARHDELLSKQFRGGNKSHVAILIASGPAMQLGAPPRFDFARKFAAGLAYLALSNGDAVTVGVVSDGLLTTNSRPQSSTGNLITSNLATSNLATIDRFLSDAPPNAVAADWPKAVRQFLANESRSGLVLMIGDFWQPNYRAAAAMLRSHRRMPMLLQTTLPEEIDPQETGGKRLDDCHGRGSLRTHFTAKDLARYRIAVAKYRDQMRSFCTGLGIAAVQIDCTQSETDALQRVIEVGARRLVGQRG